MALHLNQNIDLVVKTEFGQTIYPSRIEDIQDNQLLVAAPMKQGVVVPLRVNTKITIRYLVITLKEQGRYQAEAVVRKRFTHNDLPLLMVEVVSHWEKIQLRSYVRVNVLLEAQYNGTNHCLIKDISGGGLLMFCSDELAEGDTIQLIFDLEGTTLTCSAKVVRVTPGDNNFEYGLSFVDLDEKTREKIIRFVYERQLEVYRKTRSQKS